MRYVALALLTVLAACGGDSNEALLSGSVTGTYDTTSFTVKNGVLGKAQGVDVIALSSDAFDCSTLSAANPPTGDYAAIQIPSLATGTYTGVGVNLYQNNGSFNGVASNDGTLDVTAITADNITATITYSATLSGKSYALNGTFEVTRCK